jgi:DNA-directed RNA polymerase
VTPLTDKPSDQNWKDLYIAALFETDKTKIAGRIARAQIAIETHRRKICWSTNHRQERQALDTAQFSLQALATCQAIPPRVMSRSRAA